MSPIQWHVLIADVSRFAGAAAFFLSHKQSPLAGTEYEQATKITVMVIAAVLAFAYLVIAKVHEYKINVRAMYVVILLIFFLTLVKPLDTQWTYLSSIAAMTLCAWLIARQLLLIRRLKKRDAREAMMEELL